MRNRLLIAFGILVLAGTSATAREHWKVYQDYEVPWEKAEAIAGHGDSIFVSGTDSSSEDSLWISPDGESWRASGSEELHLVTHFLEHNNNLYAFDFEIQNSSGIRRIFRYNGRDWNAVDKGGFGLGPNWSDIISFNGHIYIADTVARGWKLSDAASADDLTWLPLGPPFSNIDATQLRQVNFAKHNGILYVGFRVAPSGVFGPSTNFYYTTDGDTWRYLRREQEEFRPGHVVAHSMLYMAANFLWQVFDFTTWIKKNAGVLPVPFLIDNQLHVFTAASQVLSLDTQGEFRSEFEDSDNICATNRPQYPYAAQMSNKTFILPCNLMSFQKGIHSLQIVSNTEDVGRPGEAITVLTFETLVNFSDSILSLSISNEGTAIAGRDIESISLSYMSAKSQNPIFVQQLVPKIDGKTWSTSQGISLNVLDSRWIVASAVISESANSGETIDMAILPGNISFNENAGFSLSTPLIDKDVQTIQTVAAAPPPEIIEKAIIYPQPARDNVRFMYTLDSTSDVTVKILDQNGYEVAKIKESGKTQNNQAVTTWNATNIAEGIYFGLIEINPTQGNKRIIKTQLVIER